MLVLSIAIVVPFAHLNSQADLLPGQKCVITISHDTYFTFRWVPPGDCALGATEAERATLRAALNIENESDSLMTETEGLRGKYSSEFGFWMAEHPITQLQWRKLCGHNPSKYSNVQLLDGVELNLNDHRPVESISWNETAEFVNIMNRSARHGYLFDLKGKFAMPTEDQWEYACRGGREIKTPYYWGSTLNGDMANCDGRKPFGSAAGKFVGSTTDVGSYQKIAPHPWGLSDMGGNVYQWCDNTHTIPGFSKSIRGGAWDSGAASCRSASRSGAPPDYKSGSIGARVIYIYEVKKR